jgi:hypothetical protein
VGPRRGSGARTSRRSGWPAERRSGHDKDRKTDREIGSQHDQVFVGQLGFFDQDHGEHDRGQATGPELAGARDLNCIEGFRAILFVSIGLVFGRLPVVLRALGVVYGFVQHGCVDRDRESLDHRRDRRADPGRSDYRCDRSKHVANLL